jgi:Flp pilus assembly protein TadD
MGEGARRIGLGGYRVECQQRPVAQEVLAAALRLLADGTPEERLAFTEDAVAKFPRDPDLRHQYAISLIASEPKQARAEVLRAVELDADGDPVRLTRAASILLDLEDREGARECAERAVEQSTDFPTLTTLRRVRGVIAVFDKDYALAERELRAAYEGEPDDEFAARDLAWALVRMRRVDEALAVVDRTLALPIAQNAYSEQSRVILKRFRERVVTAQRAVESPGASGP